MEPLFLTLDEVVFSTEIKSNDTAARSGSEIGDY